MEKRGQIYFLAAIIISGLIISLGLIHNIATAPKTDTQIFDLSKEIDFEASKVIDWGVYKTSDNEEIETKITKLLDRYSKANPRMNLVALVVKKGEENSPVINKYYKVVTPGSTSASTGGAPTGIKLFAIDNTRPAQININPLSILSINLLERTDSKHYTFDLKDGYNFYVVLIKDQDNAQRLVAAPERKQ